MKVTIFGTGYVGLVQGTVLAEVGHDVVCVDSDARKVAQLSRGEVPIYEANLDPMVRANHAAGRLHFTADPAVGVRHAEVIFLAVGTRNTPEGAPDMRHIHQVVDAIAEHMETPKIIVTRSTVPVGTGDALDQRIHDALAARGADLSVQVVSNPEFLKEGSAVADCMRPDRIIIGTDDAEVASLMRELYAPFNRNHDRILVMDRRSAELAKYAANSILATKISFMNEMANLADLLGADIEAVRHGIGSDPRIGYDYIYAGAGYGGSCFPKDVTALIRTATDKGFDLIVLKAVEQRNKAQLQVMYSKIAEHYRGALTGKVIALWGLAFKPRTDDIREAPARALMEALWQAGARVRAYDPKAMDEILAAYGPRPDLVLCRSREEAVEGADALAVVTEWQEFKALDLDRLARTLNDKVVFDGRNLYDPVQMARHGLTHYGIGRGRA